LPGAHIDSLKIFLIHPVLADAVLTGYLLAGPARNTECSGGDAAQANTVFILGIAGELAALFSCIEAF